MTSKASGGGTGTHFLSITFNQVVSLENISSAWFEFRKGKTSRRDVQYFEYTLEDSMFNLHEELVSGSYKSHPYSQFRISDPKPRLISKASVRDRLLHHALYRMLYPAFDGVFMFDSFSCRDGKGTHKAFARLQTLIRRVSVNYRKPCFALKCDIRKFFDSVDHVILLRLLKDRLKDERLLALLTQIIDSFSVKQGKGMPIGNLTSQLFANIYLDPLDKFVKHQLKASHYVRYADDFLFLADTEEELMGYFVEVVRFLRDNLKLELHPNKISLRKLSWGIDFVGYVARPHYAVPRCKTVRRMMKKIGAARYDEKLAASLDSYLGYLGHARGYKYSEVLKRIALEKSYLN